MLPDYQSGIRLNRVEKAQIYRMTFIYNYYCKANLHRDKLTLNSRFPCKISATHNRLRNLSRRRLWVDMFKK